jgi:hypothetical protein
MVRGMSREEKAESGLFKENRMTPVFIGIANSLLCVEYYDEGNSIVTVGNASPRGVSYVFSSVSGDPSRYVLSVNFSEIDLQVDMFIGFTETGMTFNIPDESITGSGQRRLAAIVIAPFFAANGGQRLHYNIEHDDFDILVRNPIPPGYVFLPDGSGSLARFKDNTARLSAYRGVIYGADVSQAYSHRSVPPINVPPHIPMMPIYGVAYGSDQNAFLSYTTSGEEYMEVIFRPSGNTTFYNCMFKRFEYNKMYFRIYNQRGSGYDTLMSDRNRYDISISYEFFAGAGGFGHPANYIGMAHFYRDYLIGTGQLRTREDAQRRIAVADDIPLRLDFMMAEIRSALIGTDEIVVTDVHGVDVIMDIVRDGGISNINAGLIGFKQNGLTGGRIDRNRFSRSIGTKGEFERLIKKYADLGADISFAQDYAVINTHNAPYLNNAAKHICGWYIETELNVQSNIVPVSTTSLLRVDRAIRFLNDFMRLTDYSESTTISGLSNRLFSQYNNVRYSVVESKNEIRNAFGSASAKMLINADAPNQYVWAYTDRFLNTPMFTSQFLVETDTVPFLQMVLHGSMEMYSPYVNFSFYTTADILRMIDYNVYPSFLFTKEPSYLLSMTNSADMFSTEFSQYEQLLFSVYDKVNEVLRQVAGLEWLNREALAPGVVVNHYSGGVKVVINYAEETVEVIR